jgi:DNA-binding response OmpR family regulator
MNAHTPAPCERRKARILIVEDEATIAFLLEEYLISEGFEIAGIAGRLETALWHIESGGFDAVILDANLAGVSAAPAAATLQARGLPFVVVSGYSAGQQPKEFSGAPRLQKPCQTSHLVGALQSILPAFQMAP